MRLDWPSRGTVLAHVEGRTLRISGEALLEGNPDFLIYPQYIVEWEDEGPISVEERDAILADVIMEAAKRGWKFEIESPTAREGDPERYRET